MKTVIVIVMMKLYHPFYSWSRVCVKKHCIILHTKTFDISTKVKIIKSNFNNEMCKSFFGENAVFPGFFWIY